MDVFTTMSPAALVAAGIFLGLVTGSFLNVVILRFPPRLFHDWREQCREMLADETGALTGEPKEPPPSLVFDRSHCPKCGTTIAWYDNIPVMSWLMLRGRCRHCRIRISVRYPAVEILTAILFVAVLTKFGPTFQTVAALVFTAYLIAGAGIDLDHQLLPDQLTLPLMWLGLLLSIFGTFTDLQSSVIGAAAGYMTLWLVYQAFRILTGKEGMGYGDFKLLAAIGAWFGWQILPAVILIASLAGAIIGIALMVLRRHGREVPIAFGPYLAMGGWIAMLWGHKLSNLYFS